jgi:hypothetical protein
MLTSPVEHDVIECSGVTGASLGQGQGDSPRGSERHSPCRVNQKVYITPTHTQLRANITSHASHRPHPTSYSNRSLFTNTKPQTQPHMQGLLSKVQEKAQASGLLNRQGDAQHPVEGHHAAGTSPTATAGTSSGTTGKPGLSAQLGQLRSVSSPI